MTFTCEHCEKPIQGVAAIHNGKFIHHRCTKDYTQAQITEKWIASGLLDGLTDTEGKINMASLLEGKARQLINE
jgi:hypothetical protein